MPLPRSPLVVSIVTVASLLTVGCHDDAAPDLAAITVANNANLAAPVAPGMVPPAPLRDAVGNQDLRTLIAAIATKTACDEIRNQ
nr:hypothetical protein [Kofleriaceae bacterium]